MFDKQKNMINDFLKVSKKTIKETFRKNQKEITRESKKNLLQSLVNILDIDDEINLQNADKKVLEKKFSATPSKLKLFKYFYRFVTSDSIHSKQEIDTLCKSIILQIKRLPAKSFLVSNKKLIEIIQMISREKGKCISSDSASVSDSKPTAKQSSNSLRNLIQNFENSSELDQKSCLNIIKNLKIKTKSSSHDTEISSYAVDFCNALKSKFQRIIESPTDYQNNKEIFESTKKIKQELEKLSSFSQDAVNELIKECISLCDEVQLISEPNAEKLKQIDDNREKEAFSIESLKHNLELTKKIVMNANNLINQYDQSKYLDTIESGSIPGIKQCEQFINSSQSQNLDKKTFVKLVNNMRSDTKNAISNQCNKIKQRSKDQIVSEILKLFN